MNNNKRVIFAILTIVLITILFFIIAQDKITDTEISNQSQETNSSISGQSPQEKTLRAFWQAAKTNDINAAMKYVDKNKVEDGYHGRNIIHHINKISQIDDSNFKYISGETSVRIRSSHFNMDYDMEQKQNGEWIIISIHP